MVPTFNNAVAMVLGQLAGIAEADADAHLHEDPRGSNKGSQLAKFFSADDYAPGPIDGGYPWCACAVCYWVQQFLSHPASKPLFGRIASPRTAAAFGLIEWGVKAGCMVWEPRSGQKARSAQRGDIVVYRFSHCGVVISVAEDSFKAVEGNTDSQGSREGWEVARKTRRLADVRAFIRLTPRAEAA